MARKLLNLKKVMENPFKKMRENTVEFEGKVLLVEKMKRKVIRI